MAKKDMNEFEARLDARFDELKWLYYELYYGDEIDSNIEKYMLY